MSIGRSIVSIAYGLPEPRVILVVIVSGLLVSRMFWLGGGMSLALWGCVTLLALQWL